MFPHGMRNSIDYYRLFYVFQTAKEHLIMHISYLSENAIINEIGSYALLMISDSLAVTVPCTVQNLMMIAKQGLNVTVEYIFLRFELKMCFGEIIDFVNTPSFLSMNNLLELVMWNN